MAVGRLNAWRGLFRQALEVIDAAEEGARRPLPWSLGGGTVLMLRYRHRVSKDIDIFLGDPQWLGHVSPRLNDRAAGLTTDYVEQANFVKLTFAEGEVDFIAAPPLTRNPTLLQRIGRRMVQVERPAEIVAKKVFHRAAAFKARDVLDLAVVIERERRSLAAARGVLRDRRRALVERLTRHEAALREDFAALDILEDGRTYDESAGTVIAFLEGLDR